MSTGTDAAPALDPTPTTGTKPSGPFRRVSNWLLASEQIANARAAIRPRSEEQVRFLSRARLASEFGNRVLDPIDPPKSGDGAALAIELYREATYWALLAASPELSGAPLHEAWARSGELLGSLEVAPAELEDVASLVNAERGFIADAELPAERQRAGAELARAFVERLLDTLDAPELALRKLQVHRALRLVLALVALVALGCGLVALMPEKPDLAKGKRWTTSSMLYPCHPEQAECGGVKTRIFFHTREESNPWIEYDLGAPTQFSSMTIRNRSDYGERAIPLVLEVSNDRATYRQIARQDAVFSVWKPTFAPQTARYVRLRVPRRTFLHLEGVQIHP